MTQEAVADRADVVIQTIYNRVAWRSALLAAVAEQVMQENRVYMDAAELTREQNAKLAEAIRTAISTDVARSDLDANDLATVFWATLNSLLALAWRPGALQADTDDLDRSLATYTAIVADGLRARPDV